MANLMGKIEEKLHIGGHHKKPQEEGGHVAGAPHHGVGQPAGPHDGPLGHHHQPPPPTNAPHVAPGSHDGPIDKIKNKVKGKKEKAKDQPGYSSSSSESDGEGGRRKKKMGVF